jgi:hypothetical protein
MLTDGTIGFIIIIIIAVVIMNTAELGTWGMFLRTPKRPWSFHRHLDRPFGR